MGIINRRRYMGAAGEIDYSKQYLTFEALEDGTFKHNTDALEYSIDGGATWVALAANTNSPTVTTGNTIMWRGTMSPGNKNQWFVSTGKFNASGNPLCLKYKDSFIGASPVDYACYRLFQDSKVVNANNLYIPASLEAKTHYCMRMFYGCSLLETAPSLPATTLTLNCYSYMFSGCSSLALPPDLPATTLANSCYQYMFDGCSSLTRTPYELPATTLAATSYNFMFRNCVNLLEAPAILPATTLITDCYYSMFRGCSKLEVAPVLPATALVSNCYRYMFNGCSKLRYIKAMFLDEPSISFLNVWVQGVSSTGVFVKNSNATWENSFGNSAIPTGWTVETASE